MRRNAMATYGWSVMSGALMCFCGAQAAHAAPAASPVQIAIGNPVGNSLVGGRISVSVAYDMGRTSIGAFALFVDDQLQFSRPFVTMTPHGIHYLELDTRQLTDGNHTVKISAMGPRGSLAADTVNIVVRNGIAGGPDLVPPLVQFRGLQDGDVVSGKISLDVLAEDNLTQDLLVSIFVNQNVSLLKNRAPYTLELDTAQYLDPATGTGKIRIEAWAYDKAENLGKARPITLTVTPVGAATNQTRKQGDPTQPAGVRPMAPDVEMRNALEPLKTPMEGSVVLPLGPRGQMPSRVTEPSAPAAAASRLEGRPKIVPGESIPVGRTPNPRMAKNFAPVVDPDFAPVGGASHSGLADGKLSVPYSAPRPSSRPSAAQARGADPVPALTGDLPPSLSGVRARTPAAHLPAPAKPAPAKPVSEPKSPKAVDAAADHGSVSVTLRASTPSKTAAKSPAQPKATQIASAQTRPTNPEIAPVVKSARPAPAAEDSSIKIEVQPRTPVNMGAEQPMPVGGANPMPSPGGPRVQIPVVAPAPKAPKLGPTGPVIVAVVPKDARPNKNGKIAAQVYRLQSPKAAPAMKVPQDRDYQITKGDTLETVARRFKVSSRSLMVANGLGRPRELRAGSHLRVPGTFDVALNGQSVQFDVTPRVENGLPLAPFRQIFEHAGGTVVWYPESQEVRAANDKKDIKLKIGSKEAMVNQMVVMMDRAAFLESGRTVVPISFMEKALDLQAEYDVKSGTIILARK